MSITVMPFDMIRTKLMSQPIDQKIYNGFFDCVKKVIRQNGPMALYTGFIPIWMRFAPATTLQLVIFDQLKTRLGFI
jgi:solute carrier family 25 protein 34/35